MTDSPLNLPEPPAPENPEGESSLEAIEELSPRHRRFAEAVAAGFSPAKIKETLDYSSSRISVLKNHPLIAREIKRISDRIHEEGIQKRLKTFADPALDVVQMVLTDKTNRVKISEKADMARWTIEKLDGKAMQKHDIGENMLGVLMDRLDAMKHSGLGLPAPRDITQSVEGSSDASEAPKLEKNEEELLDDWVVSFDSGPVKP